MGPPPQYRTRIGVGQWIALGGAAVVIVGALLEWAKGASFSAFDVPIQYLFDYRSDADVGEGFTVGMLLVIIVVAAVALTFVPHATIGRRLVGILPIVCSGLFIFQRQQVIDLYSSLFAPSLSDVIGAGVYVTALGGIVLIACPGPKRVPTNGAPRPFTPVVMSAQLACPWCHQPVQAGVTSCWSCGRPIGATPGMGVAPGAAAPPVDGVPVAALPTATTCQQCGSVLTPGAQFCGNCGTPVPVAASAPPPAWSSGPSGGWTQGPAPEAPRMTLPFSVLGGLAGGFVGFLVLEIVFKPDWRILGTRFSSGGRLAFYFNESLKYAVFGALLGAAIAVAPALLASGRFDARALRLGAASGAVAGIATGVSLGVFFYETWWLDLFGYSLTYEWYAVLRLGLVVSLALLGGLLGLGLGLFVPPRAPLAAAGGAVAGLAAGLVLAQIWIWDNSYPGTFNQTLGRFLAFLLIGTLIGVGVGLGRMKPSRPPASWTTAAPIGPT